MSMRSASLARDAASPFADPGMRLGAVVVDLLLRVVPQLALGVVGVALGSAALLSMGWWVGIGSAVVLFAIDLVLLQRYGQTIGKRVLGLRIVRTNGERASLARLFWVRGLAPEVIAMVPLVGWLFAIVDALAIFTSDRRTLHDRMADTIVVDLRSSSRGSS